MYSIHHHIVVTIKISIAASPQSRGSGVAALALPVSLSLSHAASSSGLSNKAWRFPTVAWQAWLSGRLTARPSRRLKP